MNKTEQHLCFGALDMYIRKRPGEWQIAFAWADVDEDREPVWDTRTAPETLSWERSVTGDDDTAILLRPVTPDRPVVVRPAMPVRLLPGQATDFFIGLPLWIQVVAEHASGQQVLIELPTIPLSNSWFGTPQEGELCFAMRTHAHRQPHDLLSRLHRCICLVQVKNSSKETLSFERLCLRCQHLQIYKSGQRYWANSTRLSYRGRNEWSRIIYGRGLPSQSGEGQLVADPRLPLTNGLSLHSLKSIGKAIGIS